jgi:hypothetical protein
MGEEYGRRRLSRVGYRDFSCVYSRRIRDDNKYITVTKLTMIVGTSLHDEQCLACMTDDDEHVPYDVTPVSTIFSATILTPSR